MSEKGYSSSHSAMKIQKNRFLIIVVSAIIMLLSALYHMADKEDRLLNDNIREKIGGTYISLSQGIVHYELQGDSNAQTIVLIHGGTIPMFNYNYQVSPLVESGFRILRYDQYGRGYSDRPFVEYDKKLYSNLLLELLDSLKISEPVDLLGHSFGGSLAVHFTSQYPQRVRKIILFSPMINGISDMTAFRIIRTPIIGTYISRFLILPLSVNRVNNFFNGSQDTIVKYRNLFKEQMNYKGYERSLFSMMKSDAMRDYTREFKVVGALNKKTLLIWGNADKTISGEMIDVIRGYMPYAQYKEINEGTHAFNFKRFKEFNHLVIDFLKE